jgi:hypothetical protein
LKKLASGDRNPENAHFTDRNLGISLPGRGMFSNTISSLRMVWQCIVATAFAMKLSKQAKRAGDVSAFRQSTLARTSLHREQRLYQAQQLGQEINA